VPPLGPTERITLEEAVRLALEQASTFQQAALNERIVEEDVRQARAAFLPRLAGDLSVIYNSPNPRDVAGVPGTGRAPSYIAANAVTEYLGLVALKGELDVSSRLHATLQRNLALLEAAHAGTEVARRALVQGVSEAYYGLALATARRQAAEENLRAGEEFERVTSLLEQAGEVAPIDVGRARLQTLTRRDELEQARANETVAAGALRVLLGYDFSRPIATVDLVVYLPQPEELDRLTVDMISRRPEVAQFQAQLRAAEQDVRLARAERRPGLTYTIDGGLDSDTLHTPGIRQHSGFSAAFAVSIPLFDWGASRSRERQAFDRAAVAESSRRTALRAFAQQFSDARTQVLTAMVRIQLARTGVETAETYQKVAIERYRAGETQILEVTDAQTTLIAQRTAYYQALFDYQVARARLAQAAGLSGSENGQP
jgi:outer membrane protein TolC